MASPNIEVIWQPQLGPQTNLISCPVFEVFFGGARGGGKTDGMLGEFAKHASLYGEHAIGLMVRRQRTELVETIERSRELYTKLGWKFNEQDKSWRAPNGARLRFAYLERDQDADAYQGHSYSRVYIEEAGTFPSYKPIAKLMATLRSGSGVPVGMRLTGNPGGPGHQWVKARYIDPAPQGYEIITDDKTGLERVYIPSRVGDNRYLGADYVQRLKAVGSEQLVKAWLEGDWSVIDGAFFDCWSMEKHVLPPFEIPADWLRFRSADWGSAAPFSVGWWAVAGDAFRTNDGRTVPRGCLVRYREWYGASAPNVGLKLTAAEVAKGILKREGSDKITYGVLDPAAFAEDGGPSIAQMMAREGVHFRPADNKRVSQKGALSGWDQMRARMVGVDGVPMLYVFSTCKDFIRTVPALQHDQDRPEDVDTRSEDHVADECFTADTLISMADGSSVRIADIGLGAMVATRQGAQPVDAAFTVGIRPVFDVEMSDGTILTGTAKHPVFIEGKGFVSLESLRYGDMLRTCAISSHSKAENSLATRNTRTVIGAFISGRTVSRFIVQSGKAFMATYRRAISSITSMETLSTTPLRTCLSWLLGNTPSITGARSSQLILCASTAPRDSYLNRSIQSWTSSAQTHVSLHGDAHPALTMKRASATIAALRSLLTGTLGRGSALNSVGNPELTSGSLCNSRVSNAEQPSSPRTSEQSSAPLHVVSVRPAGMQRVYNLTVAVAEEYFANGVLVHNCRYGCMSRPWVPSKAPEPPRDRLVYEAGPNGVASAQVDLMAYLEKKRKAREQRY